jgi:hypothetical protein
MDSTLVGDRRGLRPGLANQGQENDLWNQESATEPDHRELAPGYQFVGEGPRDPGHLACLGHGVDEALFGCLKCAVWGCHGRHCQVWTSTAMSTKVTTPANF